MFSCFHFCCQWLSFNFCISLVGVPVGVASSAVGLKVCTVGLKICAITTRIKKYKAIIEKNRKKHDKIVLLGKAKFDTIEFQISKALTDSYISDAKFVLVNNVLREYNKMKEESKNPQDAVEYII